MAEASGGSIYFSTSNRDGRGSPVKEDDKILRIVPDNTGKLKSIDFVNAFVT